MRFRGLNCQYFTTGQGGEHTDEVLQHEVGHGSAASVALDHIHLVRFPGVNITVDNVGDFCVSS